MSSNNGHSYWRGLAQAYASLGPPLRPSAGELALMEQTVEEWAGSRPGTEVRAVLLGVTTDIAQMRWPRGTHLVAFDKSLPMIRSVWPGDVPGSRTAVCADWLEMPLGAGSCDVVVGDGSTNCLRYPDEYVRLAAVISRTLRDDAVVMLRCYVRPERPETPEAVFAAIARHEFPTFHHFKFRLLMAMQESVHQGVSVDSVFRFWATQKVDRDRLAAETQWERSAIDMIDLYRGTETVHTFPTRSELDSVLSAFFDPVADCSSAGGCPILVMRPHR